MKTQWIFILAMVMSALVIHTAGQIEYWNHQAGTPLPMEESGKLRGSSQNPAVWRRQEAMRTGDPSLLAGRPLTTAEEASLEIQMRRVRALNQLVDWTRGMGLLQYLLAPFAFALTLSLALNCAGKSTRRISGILAAVNALAIFLMIFRGYYND